MIALLAKNLQHPRAAPTCSTHVQHPRAAKRRRISTRDLGFHFDGPVTREAVQQTGNRHGLRLDPSDRVNPETPPGCYDVLLTEGSVKTVNLDSENGFLGPVPGLGWVAIRFPRLTPWAIFLRPCGLSTSFPKCGLVFRGTRSLTVAALIRYRPGTWGTVPVPKHARR